MTGREAIKNITGNERIADELGKLGFVCVPRVPTKRMLHEAYYAALGEDANEVWQEMVEASEIIESGTPTQESLVFWRFRYSMNRFMTIHAVSLKASSSVDASSK